MGAHPTLPDEGVQAGRFGWVGALLGALASTVYLVVASGTVKSLPVALGGIVACVVAAAVFALADWERLPQPARVVPVVCGVALTAIAVENTGGTESVYGVFFPFCGLGVGYFATRTQVPWLVGLLVLAAFSPLAYQHHMDVAEEAYHALLWAALSVVTALLVFFARARQRVSHQQLQALALQDPLTGVGNRRAFEIAVRREIGRARRSGGRFSVLYVDLDGFKEVNDVLGHAAGDRLLRSVASGIDTALRVEDVVARHGGDEFAVLLPGAEERDAAKASLRVVAAIERIAPESDGEGRLSASVGIASFPRDGADLDTLMESADRALRGIKGGRAAARSLGAPAASAAAALPGPFDSGALPSDDDRPVSEPPPWPLRRVVLWGAVPALTVAAVWVAVALLVDAKVARWAIDGVLAAALVVAALRARRVTRGSERRGWLLLAIAGVAVLVPLLGAPAGVVFAAAVLLIAGCAPWRERIVLVDGLLMLVVGLSVVLVAVLPELIDRFSHRPVVLAASCVGCLIVSAGIACALIVLPRQDPRRRPDAWLLAVAFLIGSVDNIPVQLTRDGVSALPGGWYAFGLPVAAATMAAAALIRARRPQPIAPLQRVGVLLASVVPTIVGIGLAVVSLFVSTPQRVAAIAGLVLIGALRLVRMREVERQARRLAQVAERSQAARVAQSRASLTALSTALEARDGYTGHHGEQTVGLVRAVGQRLGLSAVESAEVESAALLHDIGKIGIPDAILHKPGPLDEHEREVMRAHPIIGERIVRAVPGLEGVARAVRHEHEAWDGSGYPDGLSGEAIPLASRIVLVCDAYHAMTSDRPYRAALAPELARDELLECAGRQFDPAVVSALLTLLTTPPGRAPAARNGRPAEASAQAVDAPPRAPRTPPAAVR